MSCYCCVVPMSATEKNPNRLFYKVHNLVMLPCKFNDCYSKSVIIVWRHSGIVW